MKNIIFKKKINSEESTQNTSNVQLKSFKRESSNDNEFTFTQDKVMEALKNIMDPELPVSIVDLGLIYNIEILENIINITMSLTTPGCSMAEQIADNIKEKIKTNLNVQDVNITITFDPAWEPNMMTELGKEKLGFKVKKQTDNNEEWE